MTVTGQLPEMDALVASWLPGTEGEGVADALFGTIPFRGQLSQSWPRSLGQEPINVGDSSYNPLYPFGWGLHTSTARADTRRAADVVAHGNAPGASHRLLALARARADWTAAGGARRPARVLSVLRRVGEQLTGRASASFTEEEALVAVARDIAESAMIAAGRPPDGPALTLRTAPG
jgi:beta-glucosidase